jgi:hypothetical protein
MIPIGGATPQGSSSDVVCPITFPTDADFTPNSPVSAAKFLLVGNLVALTATRKVILPVIKGLEFFIQNLTTGAQSITVIGATGTGITIATAKSAWVFCDGTNYVRCSADV